MRKVEPAPIQIVQNCIILVNHMAKGTKYFISKFADDAKLGGIVSSEVDVKRLNGDTNKLSELARKRQLDYKYVCK